MANEVNRKDLLLLLLYSPGATGDVAEPIDGRTRLMKLLFLLQKDFPLEKSYGSHLTYNFQAYHYGPFAKDVYNDLEFLENVGLIQAMPKGNANPVDQNEEEKLVEDSVIGIDEEETNLLFEEERYKLTDWGREFVQRRLLPIVPRPLFEKIKDLKTNFASLSLTSLLRYVYSSFPDYAKKSKLRYLIPSDEG